MFMLDVSLSSISTRRDSGRMIVYVDLTANPATSADSPPDLAQYADAAQPYGAPDQSAGAGVLKATNLSARPDAVKGKRKEQAAKPAVVSVPRGDDVDGIALNIIAKVRWWNKGMNLAIILSIPTSQIAGVSHSSRC